MHPIVYVHLSYEDNPFLVRGNMLFLAIFIVSNFRISPSLCLLQGRVSSHAVLNARNQLAYCGKHKGVPIPYRIEKRKEKTFRFWPASQPLLSPQVSPAIAGCSIYKTRLVEADIFLLSFLWVTLFFL